MWPTGTCKRDTGGSGGVPELTVSWNQQWNGTARGFSPPPDLIVYNEGTNDGPDITNNFIEVVTALQKVAPKAKQLLLRPFDGSHTSPSDPQIQNVVKHFATAGEQTVVYGDTTGFYSGEDGLHPFGYNHIGAIAPQIASLAAPLLL